MQFCCRILHLLILDQFYELAVMPRCEGLPTGPCPNGVNDHTVKHSQGDLFLCQACDIARFPTSIPISKLSPTIDNVENLEVNNVLCFLKNKYGKYPTSVIKSTMCEFRDDEIISAKVSLLRAVKNKPLNVQQYTKTRVGSNKTKANIDDIVNMWSLIDENDIIEQLPTYCSIDTSRIPILCDELTDLAFMRKTILELKAQVSDLHDKLNNVTSEIKVDLMQHLSQCRNNIATCSTQTYTTPLLNTTAVTPNVHVNDLVENSDPAVVNNSESSISDETGQTSSSTTSLYTDLVKSAGPNDFQEPKRKNRNMSTKRVIIGDSKHNAGFKGIAKKSVFCVNRLEPSTSTELITDHLRVNDIPVLSCYRICIKPRVQKPPSHIEEEDNQDEDGSMKFVSMRVCVPQSASEKIMSPDLWPQGVTVRPWIFKSKESV